MAAGTGALIGQRTGERGRWESIHTESGGDVAGNAAGGAGTSGILQGVLIAGRRRRRRIVEPLSFPRTRFGSEQHLLPRSTDAIRGRARLKELRTRFPKLRIRQHRLRMRMFPNSLRNPITSFPRLRIYSACGECRTTPVRCVRLASETAGEALVL